jgi:hypothetical protein
MFFLPPGTALGLSPIFQVKIPQVNRSKGPHKAEKLACTPLTVLYENHQEILLEM